MSRETQPRMSEDLQQKEEERRRKYPHAYGMPPATEPHQGPSAVKGDLSEDITGKYPLEAPATRSHGSHTNR
jgi:hypothetical protein